MDQEEFFDRVLRRLNTLIALRLEEVGPDESITERVERLAALGLTSGEIADIVRKPSNYVSAVLARRRKSQRKES